MSKSWQGGSTRAWRRIRALVLIRDGYTCQLRIPGVCTHKAEHVHHTQGRSVTGDDPRFLQSSCAACNLHVGSPEKHGDPPPRPVTRW